MTEKRREKGPVRGPSPFVRKIRDEKIAEIIDGYIRAKGFFDQFDLQFRNGQSISFEAIKEIGDILYDVKESHHLIFRRVLDPKTRRLEEAKKFCPDESEIAFMNNIGLIFHKLVVARELKYVLEHYEEDTDHYQETKKELELFLERIDTLFTRGIEMLKGMMHNYRGTIRLMALFWENRALVERAFGLDLKQLVELIWGAGKYEDATLSLGEYYLEQGWPDKAEKMFQEVLSVNPGHRRAKSYLQGKGIAGTSSVSAARQ
ncbi:MAG: tetratricopeptide repeat protein [bacterium]